MSDLQNPINIADEKTLSRTFKQEALKYFELVKEHLGTDGVRELDVLNAFAEHLDGFNVFSPQMEILALQAARKVDREFMLALIEELGMDKAREIARIVNERHIRKSKKCLRDQQNQEEEPSSENEKSETE